MPRAEAEYDEDGLREVSEVAQSDARRREKERTRETQKKEHQDSLRAAFVAGTLTMAEFAKQAREAGISASEVAASLKVRAAAETRMAHKASSAQSDAQKSEQSGESPAFSAALAAKAQGLERLRRGELVDAAEAFADGASLAARATAEPASSEPAGVASASSREAARGLHIACTLNECLCHLKLEDWAAAECTSSAVLDLDPNNVKARYRRGTARLRRGSATDALSDLSFALQLSPQDADVRKLLAEAKIATQAAAATESPDSTKKVAGDTQAPDAPFQPCETFDGAREGFIFKLGEQGLGYYPDVAHDHVAVGHDGSALARNEPHACPRVSARSYCFLSISIDGRRAGRLTFQLFDDLVPTTVRNFRALCRGVPSPAESGPPTLHYKGSLFHRVAKGFVLQGGDIVSGDGSGCISTLNAGQPFEDESFVVPHTRPGILSMANSGPNSNGCQFFITLVAASACDKKHVAFGRLVDGLPLLRRIEALSVDEQDRPLEEVMIDDCGELDHTEAARHFDGDCADGADTVARDMGGETLIHAATEGDLVLMRELLARGVPVDAFGSVTAPVFAMPSLPLVSENDQDSAANTACSTTEREDTHKEENVECAALAVAARVGNIDMLRGLLQAGANADLVDSSSRCAIHWAVLAGHSECVAALLHAGAEPSVLDGTGKTPMHIAAYRGEVASLRLLVEQQAQVATTNRTSANVNAEASGLTALHLAAAGDFAECCCLLLDAGAAHNIMAAGELSALHIAAAQGALATLTSLLTASADVNAMGSKRQKTPLHSASEYGQPMAAAALLAARADPMAPDAHGSMPLHWACKAGAHDVVGMLLGARAQPDARTKSGSSALQLACEAGAPKCLAILLRARVPCDEPDEHGVRPLHAASAIGNVDCVQLLLAEGAGVDASLHIEGRHALSSLSEAHRKTPIYLAAEKGHSAVVKILIAAGADPSVLARTETDQATTLTSALWAARRGGHAEVAEILVAAGAVEEAKFMEKCIEHGDKDGQLV